MELIGNKGRKQAFNRAITAAIFLLASCSAMAASDIWQVAAVYDGDTVVLAKMDTAPITIRLGGIDAPEDDQPYGPQSKAELERLLDGCDLHFMPSAIDRYGRTVATLWACEVNVNVALVEKGAAWVYTRYNTDKAMPEKESKARAEKKGLWAEEGAVEPEVWRREHPRKKSGKL